jgi:hypothetical protein
LPTRNAAACGQPATSVRGVSAANCQATCGCKRFDAARQDEERIRAGSFERRAGEGGDESTRSAADAPLVIGWPARLPSLRRKNERRLLLGVVVPPRKPLFQRTTEGGGQILHGTGERHVGRR